MSCLDPSYIRSIRDGILRGNIEANNNEALPDGLVGLYDKELFPPTMKWKERSELLHFLLVFSLAQKEISAEFAAEILGDEWFNHSYEKISKEEKRLQRVNELIQLHSKRFSSAGGGKYRLYHERFRVYVLQKLSEKELQVVHENLITRLELAIEEQNADEFERYALEFLSEHFTVEAFNDESKGKKLLNFTKNETIWDRQIRISNKFDWSRKGLHQAALWTSKYDQEENIDCYLDLVQLHNKEQNDAENIVRLVANNEIDLALERITAFGGPSKEEKERQFILFMLCLMELTLLESKTQPWRKEAIEKLLKHLEGEIPVDHSLVNWSYFFSSSLMSFIVVELDNLTVYNTILYSFTSVIESHIQVDNLVEINKRISKEKNKKSAFSKVITSINNGVSFLKNGDKENTTETLKNVINLAFSLKDYNETWILIEYTVNQLINLSKKSVVDDFLKNVFNKIEKTSRSSNNKIVSITDIAVYYVKNSNRDEALKLIKKSANLAWKLEDYYDTWSSFKYIVDQLINLNEMDWVFNLHKDSLTFENEENEIDKTYYLRNILETFFDNKKIEKALEISKFIVDDLSSINSMVNMGKKLYIQGENSKANLIILSAVKKAREIDDDYNRMDSLKNISLTLFESKINDQLALDILKESVEMIKDWDDLESEIFTIMEISTYINQFGYKEISSQLIKEAMEKTTKLRDEDARNSSFYYISIELCKQGELNDAIIMSSKILSNYYKDSALIKIATEYAKREHFDDALIIASSISEKTLMSSSILVISKFMIKHEPIQDIFNSIDNALRITGNAILEESQCESIRDLCIELCKNQQVVFALELVNKISNVQIMCATLREISIILNNNQNQEEAVKIASKISLQLIKMQTWNDFGNNDMQENGFIFCCKRLKRISGDEVIFSYKSGMAEKIKINNAQNETMIQFGFINKENIKTLSQLLKKHALNALFFQKNLPQDKIDRFNRTLNLQWAIDIKNQLPN